MEDVVSVFIPIVMFISIAWTLNTIVSRRALHRERMLAIEKGADVKGLNDLRQEGKDQSLKYGLLLIGVSLGIITGLVLNQFLQVEEEIPYFIGVTLFSGLGLIIYHVLKKDNKE